MAPASPDRERSKLEDSAPSSSSAQSQPPGFSYVTIGLGAAIVMSCFGMVTYARRSQAMLKRLEANVARRQPPKKQTAHTKEEHDKVRTRLEDDEW